MKFELTLAYRHLRYSPGQTLLTVMTVAISVTVMIFLNSLILGLQNRILRDQIGALPHLTIKMAEKRPRATATGSLQSLGQIPVGTIIQEQALQRTDIDQPITLGEQLRHYPEVMAVVPSVRGQAFIIRGARRYGITCSCSEPPLQEQVVGLQEDLVAGHWLDLSADEVAIGFRLANDLGASVGQTVVLESSEGVRLNLRVGAIFDTGVNAIDQGQAFLTLRTGQSLFATGRNVSSILVKLRDPFQANILAERMTASLGVKVDSWMNEQAQIVNAFNAQNSTRLMISGFSLLASAFGIASVLIVSVLQKSKQIGILKSIGAKDRQLMLVFTSEGLFVSLLGALIGSGLGFLLLQFLSGIRQVARFGKQNQLFPVAFEPSIFLGAIAAAVLSTLIASLLPAWRAARMKPVDVIRGG